ncbi:MAG: hypothetical protein ACXVHB_27750 [Solirubrobacteraceae bacterium]
MATWVVFAPACSRRWQFAVTPRSAGKPLDRIGDARINHVCVDDHVSFFVGAGSDALINAPCANDHEAAVAAVGELRELLNRG